jgi:multicomponent K+:H+ antiporter subunit E
MKPGWLAHPVQSALIAATWLLLQQSVAPAQLITATVLALVLPRLLHAFLGGQKPPKAWAAAWRLMWVVLRDIVVSNIAVAKLVLLPSARPEPVWVPFELRLRDPRAVTLLATIITTTPGTVSCVIDESRHWLLVHALDGSAGAEAIAADIRARYETPLMEIFE